VSPATKRAMIVGGACVSAAIGFLLALTSTDAQTAALAGVVSGLLCAVLLMAGLWNA
jgi:hypothetical protein